MEESENIDQGSISSGGWQSRLNDKASQAHLMRDSIKQHALNPFQISVVGLCATACNIIGGTMLYKACQDARKGWGGESPSHENTLQVTFHLAGCLVTTGIAHVLRKSSESAQVARRYADLLQDLDQREGKYHEDYGIG